MHPDFRIPHSSKLLAAKFSALVIAFIAIAVTGCTSIGPKTIPRDRSSYIDSLAMSWKRQTLLNVVKLRYADIPVFLEVSQIVSGYTLQSTLAAEAELSDIEDIVTLGANGQFTDRPTITYSPLTGDNFVKKLLSPIPPRAVLSLIQAGWSADLVLRLTVQAVNGQRNQSGLEPLQTPGDEDFYLLVELMREIQRSGAVGMRIEERDDERDTAVLFFYHEDVDAEVEDTIVKLKEVLGLEPQARRFSVAYGAIPSGREEIAILTRSAIQIMGEIAAYIDVPPEDIVNNLARETAAVETDIEVDITPLINIKSGTDKPADAFIEVEYENHWFWIESNDFASKRIFSFLMLILMISETGQDGKLPVLTIPAG